MNEMNFSALLLRLPLGGGAALSAAARRSMKAGGVGFELEPLFATAPQRTGPGVVAAGGGWEWQVARPTSKVTGAHGWELAHAALAQRLSLAGGAEVYIEPDLEQQWLPENPLVPEAARLAVSAECVFNDQLKDMPRVPGHFAWHLGDSYSQLKSARDAAANGSVVRIVHLDTGFDPEHSVVPQNLRKDLQHNFIDDQSSNDARDPGKRGLMKNPGHGTGTLSILAGGRFRFHGSGYPPEFNDFVGGAPNAEIIPVRVGKSVVQL